MADENTYSNASDLRVAAILANARLFELTRDPTQLRQRLLYVPHPLSGSLALKVPQIQRAYAMAAPGEDTAPSNTAVVDASVTLTPARRALKFYQTDLAAMTAGGTVDPEVLAQIAAENVERDYSYLTCVAGATASTNVGGGGGADFTVDNLYDALYALRLNNASGRLVAVLKLNSMNELQSSIRGETGAFQFQPATAAMLSAAGPGLQGSLLGFDIYASEHVIEDTNVNQNFAFAEGAIGYTYGAVGKLTQLLNDRVVNADAMAFVVMDVDNDKMAFKPIGNHYPAVAVLDQSRLVGITTDDA